MKKKSILFTALNLLIGSMSVVCGQSADLLKRISPKPSKVLSIDHPLLSLNGSWNFQTEGGTRGNIKVPGEWEMQGYRVAAGEKAIYHRNFEIPPEWNGQRIILKFDAVSSHALVKVNDKVVGEHEGGFVAFEFDITDKLKAGQNSITVEVRANTISDILSCVSQYAAHTVGGILRKVTLFALPDVNVADINVSTDFDNKYQNASLALEAIVANQSLQTKQVSIQYTLTDRAGKRILTKSTTRKNIAQGNNSVFQLQVPVTKPYSWTAESPYLYELTTSLISDGKVVQVNRQKVGFREIEIRKKELLVNGRPVKLKGVNRHSVHPLLGRASSPDLDRKDAALFLAGNLNYIRTSHYPPSEEFLEAADELGLYVESESALNWIMHHASPIWRHWDYRDPKFLPTMLQANIDNVVSNKKHPSILFWSLGNESRWSDLWVEVNKTVKALDPSRPTSFHDQTWGGFNNAGSKADIANYHYPGITGPAATDTMSRPTLFGEYAHLSTYNRRELLTDPGVRDAFNGPMVTFFDSIYAHKGNLGGAIWSGIDDTFHLPDGRIVGYGPWGPIDGWRREKPEYFGMKKAYSPIKIVAIKATDKGLLLEVENRYDFRSLQEVSLSATIDGQSIQLRSDLEARSRGTILIAEKKDYHSVEIVARDARGFEIERELFSKEEFAVFPTDKKRVLLQQDSAFIYVKQGNVDYTISKAYGLMTSVRKEGETILTKGPAVAIILPNSEDGGKPNVAGETYQNNIYPVKHYAQYTLFATKVEARDMKDSIVVDMDLTYQNGTGNQQFVFTKEGLLKVRYQMKYEQNETGVYQYGLMMELPLRFDKLNWNRKGRFSVYPENHIGRNKGQANLMASDLYEVEMFGEPKSANWKDDANIMGSNDFRSTKTNILEVMLKDDKNNSIRVLSNGKQASRAWKQDEHIQWLVADYTNTGSEPFYGTPHTFGRIKLKKGDIIEGESVFAID